MIINCFLVFGFVISFKADLLAKLRRETLVLVTERGLQERKESEPPAIVAAGREKKTLDLCHGGRGKTEKP